MTATGTEPAARVGRTRLTGETSSLHQLQSTALRLVVLVATVMVVAFTWDRDPVRAIGTALVGWLLEARGQILLRGAVPHLEVGPTLTSQAPGRSWSIDASELVASTWLRRPSGTDRWDWTILLHTASRTFDLRVRSGASTVDAAWIDGEAWEPILGPFLAPELSGLSTARLSDPDGDGLAALVRAVPDAARDAVRVRVAQRAWIVGRRGALLWQEDGVEHALTGAEAGRRVDPEAELSVSWTEQPGVRFAAPGVGPLRPGPDGGAAITAVAGVALLDALGWSAAALAGGLQEADVLDSTPPGAEPHDQAPV